MESTAEPILRIRADLPPDAHPSSIEAQFGRTLAVAGAPGKIAYDNAIDACTLLYRAGGLLLDAEAEAWKGAAPPPGALLPKMMTKDGVREVRWGFEETLAAEAAKIFKRAEPAITDRLPKIEAVLAKVQATIDAQFTLPGRVPTEVRHGLARMKKSALERSMFVMSRIEKGERDELLAVLGAPAWVSGLTDDQVPTLRQAAERFWLPDAFEQRAALCRHLATLQEEG